MEAECADRQDNELEALQAIYGTDFIRLEGPVIWSRHLHRFQIRLRPSSEFQDHDILLVLEILFPANYPQTLPQIQVVKTNALHSKQVENLRKCIADTSTSLKGDEMIFEVASNCQQLLDAYAYQSTQPSLEEDRVRRLKEKEEHDAKEIAKRRYFERIEAENRSKMLENQVLEQLEAERLEEEPQGNEVTLRAPDVEDLVTLHRPVSYNGYRFQQVAGSVEITTFMFGRSFLVQPVVENLEIDPLVLTRVALDDPHWDTRQGQRRLHSLVAELSAVNRLHHPSVLPLVAFQIDKLSVGCELLLLSPYMPTSLSDVLNAVGGVGLAVCRSWCIQILEGLEALHKNGLRHRFLSPDTVAISHRKETDETSVVLKHPGYFQTVCDLLQDNRLNSRKEITSKADIWQFGILVVQILGGGMLGGDPLTFVKSRRWPESLKSFLCAIFLSDPSKRPSALDLLTAQFLRDNEDFLLGESSREVIINGQQHGQLSRYAQDFDEIVSLGHGGFGQVVKARNKLDGRVYAVKKVRANQKTLSHILQEVVLLSRLNHKYVVRYYTVWLEYNVEDTAPPSVEASFASYYSAESLDETCDSTLYIQMEYCENHTLGDLISSGLYKQQDEYWRLLRQILEALAYIHDESIIHRDLKPKNIFIDENRNVKIGDFGLARSVIQSLPTRPEASSETNTAEEQLTSDVGTSLYVAIEIEEGLPYNAKADMYSLGVIFFEMVYGMDTVMERVKTIRNIRMGKFPPSFLAKKYSQQYSLVADLLQKNPVDRPSARQLLDSGRIPVGDGGSLTIREALRNNTEAAANIARALFANPPEAPAQQILYDRNVGPPPTIEEALRLSQAVAHLRDIFSRHGSVENNLSRSRIFPRSTLQGTDNIVELLDPKGNILQLPHDLTLPHARRLAEHIPEYPKTFSFSPVFSSSDENRGHYPEVRLAAAFDVISTSSQPLLEDAEALSVLCEAAPQNSKVIVNHSSIFLSVLNYLGLSVTRYFQEKNDYILQQFRFRENMDEPRRLLELLGDDEKVTFALNHLKDVLALVKKLAGPRVFFVDPLCYNPEFDCGICFLLEDEGGNEYAWGGRYDSLITRLRHSVLDRKTAIAKAVGFTMHVKPFDMEVLGRCQVLITTFHESNLTSACAELLRILWANGISADVVRRTSSSEELIRIASTQNVPIVVVVKQIHAFAPKTFKPLKVRDIISKIDADMTASELVSFVVAEYGRRNASSAPLSIAATGPSTIATQLQSSTEPAKSNDEAGSEHRIIILSESGKMKGGKKNRWLLEDRCHQAASRFLSDLSNAPLISLDLRDDVIAAICAVSPGSVDDWKRRVVGQSPSQKGYILGTVQPRLANEALRSQHMILYSSKSENVFSYEAT